MSAVDYSKMSIDEVLQKFIDTAKRTGTVFGLNKQNMLRSVLALKARQSKARVEEMQALGAELRYRKAAAELRKLFEHPDRDVRGWAWAQLHCVDPERAEAAINGLFHNLTTQQVLAWRRRILQRPTQGSVVEKITAAQLVDYFIDACERCYGATRFLSDAEGGGPSMKAHNEVSGDIYAAAKELNRRGELRALVPLLEHPLITVRQRAASYCLPLATERAIAVLEKVVATKEFPEFLTASRTLDYWRKGEYCAFPDDLVRVRI